MSEEFVRAVDKVNVHVLLTFPFPFSLFHFLLRPENTAPLFVLGDRHPALNADSYPRAGLRLARKQLIEKAHDEEFYASYRVFVSAFAKATAG